MRSCDVCGTLNFKENNYCIHCGNKLVEEHICPYCGEFNLDIANHCINCGSQINPITIDDFDILFNDYNNDLLLNAKISNEEYMQMLSTIFARAKYSELYGNTTKIR